MKEEAFELAFFCYVFGFSFVGDGYAFFILFQIFNIMKSTFFDQQFLFLHLQRLFIEFVQLSLQLNQVFFIVSFVIFQFFLQTLVFLSQIETKFGIMVQFFSYLIFAELFTVIKSDGKIGSLMFKFKPARAHRLSSINTLSARSWMLMLRFRTFTFLSQCMRIDSLRMKLIIKYPATNMVKLFVVVVFVEGILLE